MSHKHSITVHRSGANTAWKNLVPSLAALTETRLIELTLESLRDKSENITFIREHESNEV